MSKKHHPLPPLSAVARTAASLPPALAVDAPGPAQSAKTYTDPVSEVERLRVEGASLRAECERLRADSAALRGAFDSAASAYESWVRAGGMSDAQGVVWNQLYQAVRDTRAGVKLHCLVRHLLRVTAMAVASIEDLREVGSSSWGELAVEVEALRQSGVLPRAEMKRMEAQAEMDTIPEVSR